MRNQILSFIIAGLAIYSSAFAQSNELIPTSNISVVAQYKAVSNTTELRFFADQKSVLESGFLNGYTIERAEINTKITKQEDLKYQTLTTIQPFTKVQWEQAIQAADAELKEQFEVAQGFYNKGVSPLKSEKPVMDLKALMDKKQANDFQFVMILMASIQTPEIANALGLAYNDKTVKANTKYVYRVTLNNYNGPYKIVNVPYLITTNEQPQVLNRAIDVTIGDTKLGFTWEENDMVSGVVVERRNEKTGKFEPLNDKPKYSLSENSLKNGFEDKNLTNYQTYEYNFYGFNAFGEKIRFGNVKAMPKDLTPPLKPIMQSAEHIKPDEIRIKWDNPKQKDKDLKGLNIMRAKDLDGKYEQLNTALLPKETNTFIDKTFIRNGKNYYKVQAIDTAGNKSVSFSSYATLIDTIAPKKPTFLSNKMDSSGVVTLNIKPNKERDLMGYRLFMANSPEHEFSAIQENFNYKDSIVKHGNHRFKDTITLNSLSPFIYYRVKALDFHHNQSEFSEILKVKRIDTIPPTTPVFKTIVVGEDTIELNFALSQSKDVKTHFLYRKMDLNATWTVVSELENNQTSFTDKGLEKAKVYFYSLRAMDKSNLFSEYAIPISGKPYDNGKRAAVKNFKVKEIAPHFEFSWDYELNPNTFFIIYKSNSNGKLVQYKRVERLSFIEKNITKKHRYAVRVFTKDGGSSLMSNVVSIGK